MKKYRVFHFSRNDDCLGYGDGREIKLGKTLSVEGQPILCQHGLHGSISILDALKYASGSHLWAAEIWGNVQVDDDKLCGNYRVPIREYGDILPLIVEFAFMCSKRAAEYAEYAAKYAYAAEYATQERMYQENWWKEKLAQL